MTREATRLEEIRERKSSLFIDDFFSRGDSFKGQWYRLESYSKDRKGTLRDGLILLFRARGDSVRAVTTVTTVTTRTSSSTPSSSPAHRARDEISISRGARGKAGLRFIRQLGGLN